MSRARNIANADTTHAPLASPTFTGTTTSAGLRLSGGAIEQSDGTDLLTETGVLDNVSLGSSVTGAGLTGWGVNGANNDLLPESASAGIYLGVSSAVAANLLDDYEEGTWDAVVTDGTNPMTMNGSYDTGYYTKVGNLVTVSGCFYTTSVGSASGGIRITGLPFTVANNPAAYSSGAAGYGDGLAITAGHSVSYYGEINTTNIYLTVWGATTGVSGMQASEWGAAGSIMVGFSYRAA